MYREIIAFVQEENYKYALMTQRGIFRSFRKIANRLPPMDGFSWKLILRYFRKSVEKKIKSIKIRQVQRVLYMKTNTHFLSHLGQFFLAWKMFQTNVVEKIKTQILCTIFVIISSWVLLRIRNVSDKSCTENQNTNVMYNNLFFRKSCSSWDNVEKCGRVWQATDDSISHAHFMLYS